MNAEKKIEKKYVETPLMKQYYSIKAVHPDAILLFRVGDFYETFGEDAAVDALIRKYGYRGRDYVLGLLKRADSGDLLKNLSMFTSADIPFFLVGMIGSFVSALLAVKVFVALVGRMTLVPFAVYRLLIAPFVYYFMVN